tara:strand:- start:1747 stop:7200 length:5454 start_codon:yes stop_codon:yes gene_type:complete
MGDGKKIDILEFGGINTFGDPEDLNPSIATDSENARPIQGRLQKTFSLGRMKCCPPEFEGVSDECYPIPTFDIDFYNEQHSTNFQVKGLYTFISDKIPDEYRFVVTLVDPDTNSMKVYWFACQDQGIPFIMVDDTCCVLWCNNETFLPGDEILISQKRDNRGDLVPDTNGSAPGPTAFTIVDGFTNSVRVGTETVGKAWGGDIFPFTGPYDPNDPSFDHGCYNINYTGYHASHFKKTAISTEFPGSVPEVPGVDDCGFNVGTFENPVLIANGSLGKTNVYAVGGTGGNYGIFWASGGNAGGMNHLETTAYTTIVNESIDPGASGAWQRIKRIHLIGIQDGSCRDHVPPSEGTMADSQIAKTNVMYAVLRTKEYDSGNNYSVYSLLEIKLPYGDEADHVDQLLLTSHIDPAEGANYGDMGCSTAPLGIIKLDDNNSVYEDAQRGVYRILIPTEGSAFGVKHPFIRVEYDGTTSTVYKGDPATNTYEHVCTPPPDLSGDDLELASVKRWMWDGNIHLIAVYRVLSGGWEAPNPNPKIYVSTALPTIGTGAVWDAVTWQEMVGDPFGDYETDHWGAEIHDFATMPYVQTNLSNQVNVDYKRYEHLFMAYRLATEEEEDLYHQFKVGIPDWFSYQTTGYPAIANITDPLYNINPNGFDPGWMPLSGPGGGEGEEGIFDDYIPTNGAETISSLTALGPTPNAYEDDGAVGSAWASYILFINTPTRNVSYDPGTPDDFFAGRILSLNLLGSMLVVNDQGEVGVGKVMAPTAPGDGIYISKYSKSYIVCYGTSHTYSGDNPCPVDPADPDQITINNADIYRHLDIGWRSNYGLWTQRQASCRTGFIDLTDFTIYQKDARNPIVPSYDGLRFLAGDQAEAIISTDDEPVYCTHAWFGWIDRKLFDEVQIEPMFYFFSNAIDPAFKIGSTGVTQTGQVVHDTDSLKYAVSTVYDSVAESLLSDEHSFIGHEDGDRDIAQCRLHMTIPVDLNTMNKRITGLRVYRSGRYAGHWEPYRQIKEVNFIIRATEVSKRNCRLSSIRADTAWLWDPNADLFNTLQTDDSASWIIDIGHNAGYSNTVKSIGAGGAQPVVGKADRGMSLTDDLDQGEVKAYVTSTFAPPINGVERPDLDIGLQGDHKFLRIGEEFIQVTGIGDYLSPQAVGEFTLPAWDSTDEGLTGITLTFSVGGVVGDYFENGDVFRLPTAEADSHSWEYYKITSLDEVANSITFDRGYNQTIPNPMEYVGSTIEIRVVEEGNDSNNTLHISRGWNEDFSEQDMDTIPLVHTEGTHIFTTIDYNSGYWKCESHNDFNHDHFQIEWRLYKWIWRIYGGEWERRAQGPNATCGNNSVGYVRVMPSPDDDGNLSLKPWLDSNGDVDIIPLLGYSLVTKDTDLDNDDIIDHTARGAFRVDFLGEYNEIGQFAMTMLGGNTGGVPWTCDSEIQATENILETDEPGKWEVTIVDDGAIQLGEHPYENEVSIDINPRYAKIIKGRLFMGALILDPKGKAEAHPDWIAYSALYAFDVMPVSNVISMSDREGGEITGLAELFGRLIVFKPQAIFVLTINDPSYPAGWSRKESKMNIGNVAPEGIVEVMDSVYFVFIDGIYKIDANTVASTSDTPSELAKITHDIEDEFLRCDDLTKVKGAYNPKKSEVIYTWQETTPTFGQQDVIEERVWAYSIVNGSWRRLTVVKEDTYPETDVEMGIIASDYQGVPVIYDTIDNSINGFNEPGATGLKWKSKRFVLDLHQKKLIRYMMAQFTGEDPLSATIILDDVTKFVKSDIPHGSGTSKLSEFAVKRYAKKIQIELETRASEDDFSLERLQIELGE